MTEMLKQVQHDVQTTIDKLVKFVTLNFLPDFGQAGFQGIF